MIKALYAVINPVVKFILISPLHRLMSHNTVLLESKGRKSGKTYSTPVSYHVTDGHVHCFTDKNNRWWHNLRHADEVGLTLRGRKRVGKPSLLADGRPVASDVAEASKGLVFISIEVRD